MKERLMEFLTCPDCGRPFALAASKTDSDEIIEGTLSCQGCLREYRIKSGIPRILPDKLEGIKSKTAENFGYEWKNFKSLSKEYQKQFEEWILPLKPAFFKGKTVLDAGCGKGRHVYYSSVFGASEVVGVDLSEAVCVAYENTKGMENVHIIQADIYHLPLKKGFFDLAYSIGVIHHLPNPKGGFKSILAHVKPGGTMLAWMYGREGNTLLPVLNFIRANVTLKMPLKMVKAISYAGMVFIYPFTKFCGVLSSFRLTKGVAAHIPMNSFFCYLSGHPFRENASILFDQLIAPIANYYTREEFESFFVENNLKDVRVRHRNQNSWTGVGVR